MVSCAKTYEVSNLLTDTLVVSYGGTPSPDHGIAKLDWTFEATPIDAFQVSRKIAGDIWTVINNDVPASQFLYNDTIPNGYCDVFIEYKIEALDALGSIIAESNIADTNFTESRKPILSVLDSISVVDSIRVILGWEPSPSIDAASTIIYRHDNVWIEIGRVFGNQNTSFEDNTHNPCEETKQYAITTVDGCDNESPGTYNTPLNPILLHNITYMTCPARNSLSWEPYINPVQPLEKYQIWFADSSGDILIGETSSEELSYNHTNIDNDTQYSYFIRAIFGSFTSTSCTKSIITGNFIEPDSIYLANADVLHDNNFIELTIDVDLDPNTCTWQIMRSEAGGVIQTLLATLSRNDVDTSPYIYLDTTANGSEGFYNYSIKVYDSCDALSLVSDTMKTIYLTGEQLSIDENELTWNTFKGFDGGVSRYYIFRILSDGVIPIIPFDSVSSADTNYIDDVSSIAADETIFSYWIQAIEGDSNSFGYKETSNSNIISFFKETDFYFPNAFRPGSNIDANRIFKPTAIGFGGSGYLLQIYNRWGQLIFESTDYEVGWDGTYNNNISPQGAYVYRLIYKNVFDISKQQRGTVMLVN